MTNTTTLTPKQLSALETLSRELSDNNKLPTFSGVFDRNAVAELVKIAENITTPKPKRWEPKGGEWKIYGDGEVGDHDESENTYRLDGAERETQEAAERASKLITRYKRLLAYVDEHRREGEVDEVAVCRFGDKWIAEPSENAVQSGAITMPRRVAIQLIADLESGVFVYE